uniref:Cyclic nucleotide-binding domain-containing protein n=1 Tax=Cupriavidus taiwanensis TaxID=164546 RepID=A0A375HEF3_9BURK|nr:protein of unknown function [Cupriavidus taiwanensis]
MRRWSPEGKCRRCRRQDAHVHGCSTEGWIGEGAVTKREPRRYEFITLRESLLVHVTNSTFRSLMDTSRIQSLHRGATQRATSQSISMVDIDRFQDPVSRVAKSLAILFNQSSTRT